MADLPEETIDEAERLTRLARDATDENEAAAYRSRRDELLADRGFVARIRDADETLVLYPEEWVEDGVARPDRIDDTDRAAERPLDPGVGEAAEWEAVEAHNADLIEAVEDEHGPVHAANARAFADFIGNHYARRVETATADEIEEFLAEYYPRNAWPSKEQRNAVDESIERLFETAGAEPPAFTAARR